MSMILAGAVAPSAAASTITTAAKYRPDGRVRFAKLVISGDQYSTSKPWIGNDIYNQTGDNQTARKRSWHPSAPGPNFWYRFVFAVSLQNDGASNDRFRVNAAGSAPQGWTVRYVDGTHDISSAVVGGGFVTPLVSPGAEYVIEIKATAPLYEIDYEDTFRQLVSVTSTGNPETSDAVKIVVKFRACGC